MTKRRKATKKELAAMKDEARTALKRLYEMEGIPAVRIIQDETVIPELEIAVKAAERRLATAERELINKLSQGLMYKTAIDCLEEEIDDGYCSSTWGNEERNRSDYATKQYRLTIRLRSLKRKAAVTELRLRQLH